MTHPNWGDARDYLIAVDDQAHAKATEEIATHFQAIEDAAIALLDAGISPSTLHGAVGCLLDNARDLQGEE